MRVGKGKCGRGHSPGHEEHSRRNEGKGEWCEEENVQENGVASLKVEERQTGEADFTRQPRARGRVRQHRESLPTTMDRKHVWITSLCMENLLDDQQSCLRQ